MQIDRDGERRKAPEGAAGEQFPVPETTGTPDFGRSLLQSDAAEPKPVPRPGDPRWPWIGARGLRAGWSLLLFALLLYLLASTFGAAMAAVVDQVLHWRVGAASPASTILGESQWVTALLIAFLLAAFAERQKLPPYYLADRRVLRHFSSGLLAGFFGLSLLVGSMDAGGWLRFSRSALDPAHLARYGLLWACGFLLVGFFEEGTFRCYVQFTLARGVNFWWAAGIVAGLCAFLLVSRAPGNGAWGVYAAGLGGVGPAWWLERTRRNDRSFWQAAWAGSTGFGFIHTFNHGETWIGILAAAIIGFVFCVSVYVTGSAWWAIGCHSAWDWAESFVYGTADSGFLARGHMFTAAPAGSALWSGGTDGPEGSLLVLPVIAILLLFLLAVYRRRSSIHPEAHVENLVFPE